MSRSPSTKRTKEVYKAEYKVMLGEKRTNQFLSVMDLGLRGVYYPQIFTVTWKAGVKLTKARAEKLCAQIKMAFNKQPDSDCASVTLLRVYLA